MVLKYRDLSILVHFFWSTLSYLYQINKNKIKVKCMQFLLRSTTYAMALFGRHHKFSCTASPPSWMLDLPSKCLELKQQFFSTICLSLMSLLTLPKLSCKIYFIFIFLVDYVLTLYYSANHLKYG